MRYAQDSGFPEAERLALKGAADEGDVRLAPGLHVEVKGGKSAESAGPQLIEDWMEECEREATHSGGLVFLVRKRRGCGTAQVGRWHAHFRLGWIMPDIADHLTSIIVEIPLAHALEIIKASVPAR